MILKILLFWSNHLLYLSDSLIYLFIIINYFSLCLLNTLFYIEPSIFREFSDRLVYCILTRYERILHDYYNTNSKNSVATYSLSN